MKKQAKGQDTAVAGTWTFNLDETPYWYPKDKQVILDQIENAELQYKRKDKDLGNIWYKNVPASFDTETTSTYVDGKKVATMYIWMFSVNGKVILGRTWEEFESLMMDIHELTDLNHRLMVFIHNMGFDFAFFCRRLDWYKTFCVKVREPIYAITSCGIEFRDSYILTAKSLAKCGDDLLKYKVKKLAGDLDYKLVRGSNTPLTFEELQYCVHDCLVVDAVIQEKIENEGGICKIPYTNTGYVRNFMRKLCYPPVSKDKRKRDYSAYKYRDLMSKLTMTVSEYKFLKDAFAGGYTHANAQYVKSGYFHPGNCKRIDSYDFTSSYPANLIGNLYPMSEAKHFWPKTKEEFKKLMEEYLCVFEITFEGIEARPGVPDHIISVSKELFGRGNDKDVVNDNGRLVSAKEFTMRITNIDYNCIRNFYKIKSIRVGEMLCYEKGYLPKPIIMGILDLYQAKSTLKGIPEKAVEYQIKKGMLNSTYGMMCQDPFKDNTEFSHGEWVINGMTEEEIQELSPEEFNKIYNERMQEAIDKYNKSKTRFTYFPWAVFCTAYSRRALLMGILEFGSDYIYSDTDSIKCINHLKHQGFINWYNEQITEKIKTTLRWYNIDESLACPVVNGKAKPMGVWDWETDKFPYTRFRSLGAKRYMYTQDEIDKNGELHKDVLHITIAGLNKKSGADYISKQENPFEFFNDNMSIPAPYTGKNLHTYLDDEIECDIIDYEGRVNHVHEYGGVHLEEQPFTLKFTELYRDYLRGIDNNELVV